MAFLRRKLDGAYIIRRCVAGHFSTLQVSKEGIAFLMQCGVGENEMVPGRLLNYMRDMGLAFTMHLATQARTPPVTSPTSVSSLEDTSPFLAIEENDHRWSLVALFPEFPTEWIREVLSSPNASALQTCALCVDGKTNNMLPVTRLWPGKGGAIWPVVPHTEPYIIEPAGPWPTSWDISEWIHTLNGLKATGTLFKGEDEGGIRLRAGVLLVPGNSYYFVVHTGLSQSLQNQQVLPIPSEAEPSFLGVQDGWETWKIQIPFDVKDGIHKWCTLIGHPVEEPVWRLQLVSPPPLRYSNDGLPVVESGSEVIVAASPPSTPNEGSALSTVLAMEHDNKYITCIPIHTQALQEVGLNQPPVLYFALFLKKAGIYRLRSLADRANSLVFTAVSSEFPNSPETTVKRPLALHVCVELTSSHISLYAFDTDVHQMNLFHVREHDTPSIEVQSPVPVDLSWSYGGLHTHVQDVAPADVMKYVSEHLYGSCASRQVFNLSIDAGNFGAIQLHFTPAAEQKREHLTEFPLKSISQVPAIAQRIRWLSRVIPSPKCSCLI